MTADLTFYTNPRSRGRIVRWMLEETGVPYRTRLVEYGPPMKSREYRAINPLGKVPSIRHGDQTVTECPAICAYLADAFPEAGLAPPPDRRGAYYRWLFFAAGPLEQAVVNRALGFDVPEKRRGSVGYGEFETMMDALESAVSGEGFVAGASFTAADVYVGSHVGWGLEFDMIEKRPAFEDYWAKVGGRDACRRGAEMDDAAMAGVEAKS